MGTFSPFHILVLAGAAGAVGISPSGCSTAKITFILAWLKTELWGACCLWGKASLPLKAFPNCSQHPFTSAFPLCSSAHGGRTRDGSWLLKTFLSAKDVCVAQQHCWCNLRVGVPLPALISIPDFFSEAGQSQSLFSLP